MTKIKQSLDSFDWDAMAKEADFFGENAPEGMILEDDKTSRTDKEKNLKVLKKKLKMSVKMGKTSLQNFQWKI